MNDIVLIQVGDKDPGTLDELYPPGGLPDTVTIGAHAYTARAALGRVNNKCGLFQRENSGDTIYLLALQTLAEGTVGVFNTLLVEILGKITARTSKIVVRVGTGLPDT
jgi:hypothetical protein